VDTLRAAAFLVISERIGDNICITIRANRNASMLDSLPRKYI